MPGAWAGEETYMSVDEKTRERIDTLVASNSVVLFMKGTREQPHSGGH